MLPPAPPHWHAFAFRARSFQRAAAAVQGRCSYTSKLDLEGDHVAFTPSGSQFTLTCGAKVGRTLGRRQAHLARSRMLNGCPTRCTHKVNLQGNLKASAPCKKLRVNWMLSKR